MLADFTFTRYFTVTCETCASNKLQRLINENHNDEIPIFGSSRAEKGYLPDSLGDNFYNYGLPNQSFDVTAFLLQFELQKNKQLVEMIRNNPSRQFVFTISPYHWSARSSVQNFYEMLKYFHHIDEQFLNATFIYFDTSGYGDEYFKDTVHLNIYGAAKFSAQLREELLNRGIIN